VLDCIGDGGSTSTTSTGGGCGRVDGGKGEDLEGCDIGHMKAEDEGVVVIT